MKTTGEILEKIDDILELEIKLLCHVDNNRLDSIMKNRVTIENFQFFKKWILEGEEEC